MKLQGCWPENLKKTKQREQVLQLLEDARQPLSAVELYRALVQLGKDMPLSTIYRVLTAFEEAGLVEKYILSGQESKLYRLRGHHEHFAICLGCHRQFPLKECPLERMGVQTEEEEFTVTDHRLELYGYCKECQKRQVTKKDS